MPEVFDEGLETDRLCTIVKLNVQRSECLPPTAEKKEIVFDKLVKEQKNTSHFVSFLFCSFFSRERKKQLSSAEQLLVRLFEKIGGARQSMKVIASQRSNHIYPVSQLKVSLAFKLPNKIAINRNQWVQRRSAQTLHFGFVFFFSTSRGCGHMVGSLIPTLLGMRHSTLPHTQRRARDVLTLIICRPKKTLIVVTISNREVIFVFFSFCECIVKVIFSAVNLPSQITLLSLGISYVFPSLSPLNLPLSCPEPFVASRARRSEVLKVDVWVGNSANANVAYGSLPSAFCSPRACGACQLSLVSAVPQSQRPHGACITLGSRGCLCVRSHSWGARGGGQAEMSIMALQPTNDGRSKRKVQTRELAHPGGRKAEFFKPKSEVINISLTIWQSGKTTLIHI